MKITYCRHSGFAVRTDKRLLVFDYLGEGIAAPEKDYHAIAFVSHAHGDHFHPSVVEWMKAGRAALVTGYDVDAGGIRLSPGEKAEIDGAKIEAFGSTDEGVSFLVSADGMNIFHAGDLNFWHWKNESDEAYVREAEAAFEAVLDTLRGRRIDLAFFPVDPRMGEGHEEGAMRFIETLRPKVFIPMHFWDEPAAAEAMKQKLDAYCANTGESVSSVIRRALIKLLESE